MSVARARACVGARFRLHGRAPDEGLDCVGLAAFALRLAAPSGYAMRGGVPERIAALIDAAGLVRGDVPRAGDLALFATGPGQLHLAILTGDGIIHACAMQRRVVERPGVAPWPMIGVWRKLEK